MVGEGGTLRDEAEVVVVGLVLTAEEVVSSEDSIA
jgi:hypothetical protein